MQVSLRNGQMITVRMFQLQDRTVVSRYLNNLSDVTRQRFSPHAFDEENIQLLYQFPSQHIGFVALNDAGEMIGYAVVKIGYLQHEAQRLRLYGLELSNTTDCTFAPSVADTWQSSGAGSAMMVYVKKQLKEFGIQRVFLWGGVQLNNIQAVSFYRKQNFIELGYFEHNGTNADMMLLL
jgi:diamine N-acetyltransferase